MSANHLMFHHIFFQKNLMEYKLELYFNLTTFSLSLSLFHCPSSLSFLSPQDGLPMLVTVWQSWAARLILRMVDLHELSPLRCRPSTTHAIMLSSHVCVMLIQTKHCKVLFAVNLLLLVTSRDISNHLGAWVMPI